LFSQAEGRPLGGYIPEGILESEATFILPVALQLREVEIATFITDQYLTCGECSFIVNTKIIGRTAVTYK
jgi:hypothetical protein